MLRCIRNIKAIMAHRKYILIITLVYIASQSILLIITGRWWDDWIFYNQTTDDLIKIATETGRISWLFIIKFAKILPEWGYRILTYFMFYFGTLFFYRILKRTLDITDRACCIISCIYIIIPANDARIMLCVFPYTIGLYFFLFGFYLLTFIVDSNREKKLFLRIVDLILFWLSYILNSNLVLYSIPLLYIVTHEQSLKRITKYIDYILLPVVFYFGKRMFFTPYGGYEGYNEVSIDGILNGVIKIFPADIIVMVRIVYKLICYAAVPVVIIVLMNYKKIWKSIVFIKEKKLNLIRKVGFFDKVTERKLVKLLVVGFLVLSAGLFAYVAVRGSCNIYIKGLEGRDATLVPLGASIIIYALIEILFIFNKNITKYIYILIIMCGVIHFNSWYLLYQSDYYSKIGFQYQLAQHKELSKSQNIIYISENEGVLNDTAFYVLNANAEIAYGDQKRLIMNGFKNAKLLQDNRLNYFVESGNYHMMDYDTTYKQIDAVIKYLSPISSIDALKLRVYESFRTKKFRKWIEKNCKISVIMAGTDEYNRLLIKNGYINVE